MRKVAHRTPDFSPPTMLDAGAGPGTPSWAAVEIWPGIAEVTMLDSNPRLLAGARAPGARAPHTAIGSAQLRAGDLAWLDKAGRYDCVVASDALAEFAESRAGAIAAQLWAACRGGLVIIEPGTPTGFARVRTARDRATFKAAVKKARGDAR
jgi:ribosomal protein RSM22 (predicted rRNA methylase)